MIYRKKCSGRQEKPLKTMQTDETTNIDKDREQKKIGDRPIEADRGTQTTDRQRYKERYRERNHKHKESNKEMVED